MSVVHCRLAAVVASSSKTKEVALITMIAGWVIGKGEEETLPLELVIFFNVDEMLPSHPTQVISNLGPYLWKDCSAET